MELSRAKRNLVNNLLVLGIVWGVLLSVSFMQPKELLIEKTGVLELKTVIPEKLGNWQVVEVENRAIINPRQQQILAEIYTDVLERVYVNSDGYGVMFTVAYGQDQSDRLALHYPNVCYPAQGFKISNQYTELVDLGTGIKPIPLDRMLARYETRHEPVTYWTTMGEKIPVSSFDRKKIQVEYGLEGVIPDGMLIRISSIDRNERQAYAIHNEFIKDLSSSLDSTVHSRFFGAPQ